MPEPRLKTGQRRSAPGRFVTRAAAAGAGPRIEGYFAVYNSPYVLWDYEGDRGEERVAPGAFDGCLTGDVRALIDHDTRLVLGRTVPGTLQLRVDDTGLWGGIDINPDDAEAMNCYARVRRGDVSQCSFGFDILDEDFEIRDGVQIWLLRRVQLYEVSICTFPAYEATTVEARKQASQTERARRLDAWRRDMKRRIHHGT